MYTVTSKNLLLKSLLFLFINTSIEADYYIICCHSNNQKKTVWHSIWNLKMILTILVYQVCIALLTNTLVIMLLPFATTWCAVANGRSIIIILNIIYVKLDCHMWPTTSKVDFCRQKWKFVLFSHEILWSKAFQMTYYLFMMFLTGVVWF